MKHKTALYFVALALVIGVLNYEVTKKEAVVEEGRTVLLELAPRDPRSLMQGDYMVLRYALAERLSHLKEDGQAVLALGENNVGVFQRLHDGSPLAKDEVLLNYRVREKRFSRGVSFGAQDFFFQEGTADVYAPAQYGELRVDSNGKAVLIGLRDAELNILGEQVAARKEAGIIYGR